MFLSNFVNIPCVLAVADGTEIWCWNQQNLSCKGTLDWNSCKIISNFFVLVHVFIELNLECRAHLLVQLIRGTSIRSMIFFSGVDRCENLAVLGEMLTCKWFWVEQCVLRNSEVAPGCTHAKKKAIITGNISKSQLRGKK